ncbi:hypothetical protein BXZ70DRAFT_902394 [Cristinia sonorae]|uniref:Uncharacterized protein n=1 Tax=Cristinia sonorae TaxID=1940300 RepID=A0A8K0UCW7_9AGAR|nr:hypothetical protein BXZ70DRAFT_902394 [Cristinia sonorae]
MQVDSLNPVPVDSDTPAPIATPRPTQRSTGHCSDRREGESPAIPGFLWEEREVPVTPPATTSETLRTIPSPPLPPEEVMNNASAWRTINEHWDLFSICWPTNGDRFEHLLSDHPNRPLVKSVVDGLMAFGATG